MPRTKSSTEVEYREIEGFPGYRVGSDGSVWSRLKKVGLGRGTRSFLGDTWNPLKGSRCGRYLRVGLCRGGECRMRLVHQLVLEAFVGPRPPGLVACHRNDIGTDNRVENLRWGTHRSNSADAVRNGRTVRGEKHHSARLTAARVLEIRRARHAGATPKELAATYGVSNAAISAIVLGDTWKQAGGPIAGRPPRRARFGADQVVAIREARRNGARLSELAAKYATSKSTISKIALGLTWKHLLPA